MANVLAGRPSGRSSKLTPELQEKFCQWIRKGNSFKTACKLVRIDYSTFHEWMLRGEQQHSEIYINFRDAVMQADAEHEASIVEQWETINQKMLSGETKVDWRSMQANLTYRHKWQPPVQETKTTIEQNTNVTVTHHDLSKLSVEQLQQLKEIMATTTPQIEGEVIEVDYEDGDRPAISLLDR